LFCASVHAPTKISPHTIAGVFGVQDSQEKILHLKGDRGDDIGRRKNSVYNKEEGGCSKAFVKFRQSMPKILITNVPG
jgi:hypothetical protein